MASLLDNILSHRSPLVIGYAGWDGDVLMSALQRRLQTRLPLNLYWFCYRKSAAEVLPAWLKDHEDVCIVLPTQPKPDSVQDTGDVRVSELQTGEQSDLTVIVSPGGSSGKEPEALCLPAQQVLDELIQAFGLRAPDLTIDPLSFYAKHLRSSLPHGGAGRSEGEVYFIDSVIMRIERASQRENESIQQIESQMEEVRDAVRRSQYREGIANASRIRINDLDEDQLAELSAAVQIAVLGLGDDSSQKLEGWDLQVSLTRRLQNLKPDEPAHDMTLGTALIGKGRTLVAQERHMEALPAFEEVRERFAQRLGREFQRLVLSALRWKANALNMTGQAPEAVATYDEIISTYGAFDEVFFLESVARTMLDKGNKLYASDRKVDALATYDEFLKKFGGRGDDPFQTLTARALVRKGVALESLDRTTESLEAYESVEKRFGAASSTALSAPRREALRRAGQRLLSLNRTEEALLSFQRALQIQPTDVQALSGLGNTLRATGQYERALGTFQSIVKQEPEYLLAHNSIADTKFDLGLYAEAKTELSEIITRQPQYIPSYLKLAELGTELGEFDEAREACALAQTTSADLHRIRYQQALIETEAQNYPLALQLLEQSLAFRGVYSRFCYSVMGSIFAELGLQESAIDAYSKAIENGVKSAHLGIGNLLLGVGQLEKAELSLTKAFDAMPAATGPRFRLAILYGISHRQDDSKKMMLEVLSMFRSNMRPGRVLRRVTALAGIGELPQAIKEILSLKSNVPKLSNILHDFWNDLKLMARVPSIRSDILSFCVELERSVGLIPPRDVG